MYSWSTRLLSCCPNRVLGAAWHGCWGQSNSGSWDPMVGSCEGICVEPSGWTQCAFDKQHSELRKHYSLSSGPHRGGRAASATEERQNVAGLQSRRLQGLLIDLGVHGHPSALWGRPGQRSLGLKHRVAAPCFARSEVRSLPGSLLPGRVMGGSVWSSEGGVCPSPEPLPPPHSHQERTWDEEACRVKKPSSSG